MMNCDFVGGQAALGSREDCNGCYRSFVVLTSVLWEEMFGCLYSALHLSIVLYL